jgi:peptide/nickel transport system substrate-binding protein
MRGLKYPGLVLWLLGAAMLALVACGSTETITVVQTVVVEKQVIVTEKGDTVVETVIVKEKGDTVTVVATPTATNEERTMAAENANKGGHLRISSVGSVQSFDPLWTTASSTGNVSSMILEALFAYKEDFTLGKMLVDDWTVSADGLKWTFKIREGVEFHDGSSLTTEQVVGTLRRQSERAPVFKLVWTQFGPETFDEFITVDSDLEFSMNLKSTTGLVLDALGPQGFAPQIVVESWYSLPATESAPGTPIGTGPYRFESWTPGDRWTAIPYDNYSESSEPSDGESGKHTAFFDRVSYLEIPDQSTRVAALQTGAVDLVQEFSQDLIGRLKADDSVQLIANAPLRLLGHFNYQIPPFNDPEHGRDLRRAVVMAYNNEKALLAAAGTPDRINLCASLMECGSSWENNAGSENMYNAQRIDDAKKIVADAGYAGYTIRLMDPADRQPAHGAAQVTREVLEDIGFKVDLRVMDWATMVQDRATVDRWEFFHTWSGRTVRLGPIGHLRFGELQHKAWFNQYPDTDGTQRKLFEVFAAESDPVKINAAMEEFQQYFYDDAIFLQVGEFFSNWAASSEVEGLHGNPGGQKPYDKFFK